MMKIFDRNEHIYKNEAFIELTKDAIRFFNGTPVHTLPPPERFKGVGVYAIYYTGKYDLYRKFHEVNRMGYNLPIYVGKAVPRGWRQSRVSDDQAEKSAELYTRLKEHSRNIGSVSNLNPSEFFCRFMILEGAGSDMIGTVEASLIKFNKPLWNNVVDGFGNHTPGAGRFEQAKSEWDVLHPGRSWAAKCKGIAKNFEDIKSHVQNYFKKLV